MSPVPGAVGSLWDMLSAVPDHRRREGKRYPLASLLLIAVAATALQLLKSLPLQDVIITGDAMFTQREICRVIKDVGGDCFFTVKDNQPALKADIALAFRSTSPFSG
jgi:hypothetical protein